MLSKAKGSNQYETKYKYGTSAKFLLASFLFITGLTAGIDWYHNTSTSYTLYASDEVVSPPVPTTTPEAASGQESDGKGEEDVGSGRVSSSEVVGAMEQIVIDTFGDHADKAFQLLECENRSLDPEATNDNREWGGTGVDRGLFQINDYWQGIRHEGKAQQFLYDPQINASIAWRLYEDSGYSFKMWTCGRNLGI